jgi:hypothetical protein
MNRGHATVNFIGMVSRAALAGLAPLVIGWTMFWAAPKELWLAILAVIAAYLYGMWWGRRIFT